MTYFLFILRSHLDRQMPYRSSLRDWTRVAQIIDKMDYMNNTMIIVSTLGANLKGTGFLLPLGPISLTEVLSLVLGVLSSAPELSLWLWHS